ncbi:FAD-binding oxidoreductase [Kribbella sandramycini]|uniref:FAD-binding oxidoreductase n=1 Tax=Kribbella sandramycini TaxID=60450 RepID=A0A7Y4L832_9ACTN|nr:FAD-binding oxidoreductase [Kribbella sandramycini]MBB6566055.1 FAD/FMN-containing dehydrogenase [Kribbella sandramycini]NOL45056.1 FAD-binding oxidoreductase [Kribbella sandramycini]
MLDLAGTVLTPGQDGYDDARRLWNAQHDRRPAVIAQVQNAADVQAAVRYGVENGLEIAVRGGAHSIAGASSVDDGLMIDLSALNSVTVDPEARRARVGGGALLRDLDAATQAHGLAVPAGVVSHTGVGGLTLGGGMGWLTRKYGLSIDNLESVQIVTADGSILRAAEDENPDLFWGVRGGGGNFGVITEFEFRLSEAGPMVNYDLLFWTLDQGADVLRLARKLYPTLSDDTNIVVACLNAPPAPFVPEDLHFAPGYGLVIVGFGTPEEQAALVERIRTELPPAFAFGTPMPYTALQQSLDEANGWGHYSYEKGAYLPELTDEAIAVITEHVPRKQSPLSATLFYRLDRAYSAVDDDATAFGGSRTDQYAVFIVGQAPVPELFDAEQQWVRSFWEALQPATSGIGSYVNGMTEPEDARIRATYGSKYERLQQLKAKYDPDNVFHRNANIRPA